MLGPGEGALRQAGLVGRIKIEAAIQRGSRQQGAGELGEISGPAEVGDGAGAGPHPLRGRQPLLQIGTRQGDGILQRIIQRHDGGDGAGVAATGAVAVAGRQARRP
ncbi:hypothetical protein D3C79_679680 [compost metagenome]